MVATADPSSPTSPNGGGFRAAMSEQEALQIQREAYALAHAKKEEDAQRRALHAQATNTHGISEEEKRKRILAYMCVFFFLFRHAVADYLIGRSKASRMMRMRMTTWTTTTMMMMTFLETLMKGIWMRRRMSMGWVVSFE
jgi:hypothetical protein